MLGNPILLDAPLSPSTDDTVQLPGNFYYIAMMIIAIANCSLLDALVSPIATASRVRMCFSKLRVFVHGAVWYRYCSRLLLLDLLP